MLHRSAIRAAGAAAMAARSAALAARALSSQAGAFVTVQEQQPGVFALALSREDGKNSFSKAMLAQFCDAIDSVRYNPAVRVLILHSTVAKVFCAGADLKERATMPQSEVAPFVGRLRSSFTAVEQLPFPTIAAIEGAALGGGLELALCCDLRIAGKKALLGLPETGLAIIPGAGGTQRLPRLIGEAKAKELIFTARKLNADQAAAFGIVNEAVEEGKALDRALEIAAEIAKNGPIAVQAAKSAITYGLRADLATGLEIEKLCYAQVIGTEDRVEGLKAFKEKRAPVYKGK